MVRDDPKLDFSLRVFSNSAALLTKFGIGRNMEQVCRMPMEKRKRHPGEKWLNGSMPRDVAVSPERIPVRHGSIAARLYRRADSPGRRPIVLFLHGGGWVFGGLSSVNRLCAQLASESCAVVVSVDYRLAPECPYPAGLDDCFDALTWLIEHTEELDGERDAVAVMGESAGGNLAAAVCMRCRDEGGPAIALQALIYPVLDATLQSPSLHRPSTGAELNRRDVATVIRHYVADADPADPLVSPLLATDLSKLPPAVIITADCDVLRDDGRRYAERLTDAGVAVRYTNYLGMPHGFLTSPRLCRPARQARGELAYEIAGLVRRNTVTGDNATVSHRYSEGDACG